jgi:lipopolysaccharide export system permease protein
MRILDQQRYWAFLKAYLIAFTSLVGLYVVLDAFAKIDEFAELIDPNEGTVAQTLDLLGRMGRFYLIQTSKFYDDLCGVISMMAAIFTVTWMQKNNELLAMLAAGVSTQRVIRPVLISAVLVQGLAVANQEFLIPRIAEELQRPPDMKASGKISKLYQCTDVNGIAVHGNCGFADTRIIERFDATLPASRFGTLLSLQAARGLHIPDTAYRAPIRGGWLLQGARISPPRAKWASALLIPLTPEQVAAFPQAGKPIEGPSYFLRSDVTFAELTRSRQWFYFASTPSLLRMMAKPIGRTERMEYAVFLHARILRPLSSLTLMFLALPLVLGGTGRNMFINLGLSLATSGIFYASAFLVQYLAKNDVVTPELAAWLPLIAFGTLAASRWDRIRT